MRTFDFIEYAASHAPALILLEQLGYAYIPPPRLWPCAE